MSDDGLDAWAWLNAGALLVNLLHWFGGAEHLGNAIGTALLFSILANIIVRVRRSAHE